MRKINQGARVLSGFSVALATFAVGLSINDAAKDDGPKTAPVEFVSNVKDQTGTHAGIKTALNARPDVRIKIVMPDGASVTKINTERSNIEFR